MKILITGAGGFLGTSIINRLVGAGTHIVYATSLHNSSLDKFKDMIHIVSNDSVFDFDFGTVDLVINCAFPRAMGGADFAKGLDYQNLLLQAISDYESCGFIDISSQSIYSYKRRTPASEKSEAELTEAYDVGKYCMEMLVDARLEDHKRVHLRIASLVGPGFDQRIVNKFIKKVIAGDDIEIVGGKQLFGFLDVRDCSDAICAVIDRWDKVNTSGDIYNVGAQDNCMLLDIAKKAVEVGKEFGYKNTKITVVESDVWQNSSVNASKFYQTFEWKPLYTLSDTIKTIMQYEIRNSKCD